MLNFHNRRCDEGGGLSGVLVSMLKLKWTILWFDPKERLSDIVSSGLIQLLVLIYISMILLPGGLRKVGLAYANSAFHIFN